MEWKNDLPLLKKKFSSHKLEINVSKCVNVYVGITIKELSSSLVDQSENNIFC